MPIIGGPVATLLITLALAVAMAAWLVRRIRRRRSRPADDGDIDHEELAAAEREVRDLKLGHQLHSGPEGDDVDSDDVEGDDWGPGAGGRRPQA